MYNNYVLVQIGDVFMHVTETLYRILIVIISFSTIKLWDVPKNTPPKLNVIKLTTRTYFIQTSMRIC